MAEEKQDTVQMPTAPRDDVDDYIFRREEDWLVSDR